MYTGPEVVFRVRPRIDSAELNVLHAGGFGHPIVDWDWTPQLESHSLAWIGAFRRNRLVGFVNLAWDGGVHAFLLDTVVDARLRGRGIGTSLVREAIAEARRTPGIEWVHVDSEETLMEKFYFPAGFSPAPAGTVNVLGRPPESVYTRSDVRRVGDVVVRNPKPWTPAVHALLRHLEDVGFAGAPRVIGSGFDEAGNETLSWVDGDTPRHGLDTVEAASALGSLLRELHDATSSFVLPDGLHWKPEQWREVGSATVIGHCDNGFWNVVLRDGLPVAFIDWDFAGPIDPRVEVAATAMLNCNLYSDDIAEMHGFAPVEFRCGQLRALVDAYGMSAGDRVGLIDVMIENTIMSMDADTHEAQITPETKSSDALWGLTWQARTAAWLLRNRRTLEKALE